MIVAAFAYEFALPDDSTAKVPCVFVVRVRDGRIIESRDYVDPIRTHTARGDLGLLITSLRKGAPRGFPRPRFVRSPTEPART
ncbi:hypothetical protein [Streptomyces sp. NPDC002580]|uniref:hypothetical protein n=1 Tax=Streptomyces sp. NPDC002580 TaxID=3364653 RepID=UPI0036CAB5AB